MPRCEEESYITTARYLPRISKSLDAIAREMKIANDFKALELKGRQYITPEMVDDVLDTRSK